MGQHIVFGQRRPESLDDLDVDILEEYDFGDGVGYAAHVDVDGRVEAILGNDEDVLGVEGNLNFQLRAIPAETAPQKDRAATIGDYRNLHDVAAKPPSGEGKTIVVMDSGVDDSHPVFSDASVTHVDMTKTSETPGTDEVGHGTAVAGHIHRLAPGADIISLRIFGNGGSTGMNTILRAYEWLHQNDDQYDAVNMSWGAHRAVPQIDRLHTKLIRKGVRDIVAAGNTGGKGGSPATAKLAFSVGACNENGEMASFSSYNPGADNPDVTAIGVETRLPQAEGTAMGKNLDGRWVRASGTSFAAPAVSAMVLKALNTKPIKDVRDVRELLVGYEEGSRDIEDTKADGAGVADHKAAIDYLRGRRPDATPDADANVWSFAGNDVVYLNADWLDSGEYTATLEEQAEDGTLVRLN